MTVAAFFLSIIALIASIASAFYTRRQAQSSDKVAAIEAERRADEVSAAEERAVAARRADLRLQFHRTPQPDSPFEVTSVVVINKGQATAEDVAVHPVATVGDGDQWHNHGSAPWPRTIHAEDEQAFIVVLTAEATIEMEYTIDWTDGEGHHHERKRVRRIL